VTVGADWLIVFVKAPTPGEVKTRLLWSPTPPRRGGTLTPRPMWGDIPPTRSMRARGPLDIEDVKGPMAGSRLSGEEAAQLYRCLVLDTLGAARGVRGARLVVAYAANSRLPDLVWLGRRLPMFIQQGRGLGERLHHAVQHAFDRGARRVVVVGSDAPDLTTPWLRQAFRALARYDVVLGPTQDGGYHLIGLNQPMPSLFVDMPWSTPLLFQRTIERIRRLQVTVHSLEPLADLDTPKDLQRYLTQPTFRHRRTSTAHYLRTLVHGQ